MIDTNILLLFIAGIFLIGFFGNLFFRKTKISDLFFLILIGFLLGPGLHIIPPEPLVLLKSLAPFFGALALMVLLFEGGLHLNFYKVLTEFKNATLFTLLVFLSTVFLSSVTLYFVFKIPLIYGLLIGAIVGGTSSAVIIPLVSASSATEDTKTFLTLESAITDSLCVVFAIAILDIIVSQTTNVQLVAQNIFAAYAISVVIGLVAGLVWISVLKRFRYASEFGYMLTFSFLIIIYVLSEFLKGNGAFCALIFGIVLGNYLAIFRSIRFSKNKERPEDDFDVTESIKKFQTEFSLFIKSFFFIYLGIIVDFSGLSLKAILITIILVLIAILTRILIIKMLYRKESNLKKDSNYIVGLHARGLAAAVLATFPLAMGIDNEITRMIIPIAFLFIILTNLSTTIMLFITEHNTKKKTIEQIKQKILESKKTELDLLRDKIK